MPLSKLDIAALRKADCLCVHLNSNNPKGTVRVIKRKERTERDPFAQDVEHILEATVTLNSRFGVFADEKLSGVKCFSMVNFYHNQHSEASTIIHALKEGDEITFRFDPDAHSNGYVAKAGLHADVMHLEVRRTIGQKTHTLRWELDQSICPENSARMCQGAAVSKWYRDSAEAA